MDLPHAHSHSYDTSLSSTNSRGQKRPQQRPLSLLHTPSTVQQQRIESSLSTNQRRLHVRNDKFRAPHFSAHNLGAKFSRIFHGQEDTQSVSASSRSRENRPPSYQSLRSSRSNDNLTTPLGVLHELTNSTRSCQSLRRSAIPVFEDEPKRPLLEGSPASPESVYHDASSPSVSPAFYAFAHIDSSNMHLRELSGNELRSPSGLSSPLTRSVKTKKTRNLNLRNSSFDSVQYIEGLEKELTMVKAEQYSPSTGKTYAEKLRSLQSEYNQLEAAFRDLEHHFEDRIKDATEHKTAMEGALRRKIKELEELLEEKDLLVQELECAHEESRIDLNSIDTLKARVEKLELEKQSLEDSNRSIERRNEVLTELLAMSPTKAVHGFEGSSPVRNGTKTNPRPRSIMIPRLPTSPSISHSSRPQSLLGSPALSARYFSPLVEEPTQVQSTENDGDPEKQTRDTDSIDPGLGESCSVQSTTAASSRRSTMASQSSASLSVWGFPLPVSPSEDRGTVRQAPKRKPRRFVSGSTQLKPLLLPTITSESGNTQTSGSPQLISPGRSDVPEESMDPTTSFPSRSYGDSTASKYQTPWLNGGSRTILQQSFPGFAGPSKSMGEEELMGFSDMPLPEEREKIWAAFELPDEPGSPNLPGAIQDEEEITALLESPSSNPLKAVPLGPVDQNSLFLINDAVQRGTAYGNVQTLDLEMPAADLSAMKASPHMYTPISQGVPESTVLSGEANSEDFKPYATPRAYEMEGSDLFLSLLNSVKHSPTPNSKKRRKSTYSPEENYFISSLVQQVQEAPSASPAQPPRRILTPTSVAAKNPSIALSPSDPCLESQSPIRRKMPDRSLSPFEMLQKKAIGPRPLASVTIQTIYGTLSRYTTYIREIKRDPMALARRVIANAWCSNWKRLGKLSWWVLGLFLVPKAHRDFAQQVAGGVSDWDDYDGENIAERVHSAEEETRIMDRGESSGETSSSRRVRFDEQNGDCRMNDSRSLARPTLKTGKEPKTTWSKSLFLWGKFSVAILLAVGGAVVKGPAEMMKDCDEHTKAKPDTRMDSKISPVRKNAPTPNNSSASNQPSQTNFSMDYALFVRNNTCTRDADQEYDGSGPFDRSKNTHSQPEAPNSHTLIGTFSALGPSNEVFAFGLPRQHESLDRGRKRPSPCRSNEWSSKGPNRSILRNAAKRLYDPESPDFERSKGNHCGSDRDIGTLKWMQSLGVTDFTEFGSEETETSECSRIEVEDHVKVGTGD